MHADVRCIVDSRQTPATWRRLRSGVRVGDQTPPVVTTGNALGETSGVSGDVLRRDALLPGRPANALDGAHKRQV